jgi:hypothetical protein
MHPEISRRYGEQHRTELHRQAERWRAAARPRRPGRARLAGLRAAGPLAARLRPAPWRRRADGGGAPQAAPLGVFLAGPDAFGFRTYLTTDEARQLAADWAAQPARFGDRAGTRPAVRTAPCSSSWCCWGARSPTWWAPPVGCREEGGAMPPASNRQSCVSMGNIV